MARWGIPGHLAMSALEGIRTPNLLIRSQMLYPLSYERIFTCERALLYISPFFRAKRTGVFIVTWSAFHILLLSYPVIVRRALHAFHNFLTTVWNASVPTFRSSLCEEAR